MMKPFFSVFMALTVSVGVCVSSHAELRQPYNQSDSVDGMAKYREDSGNDFAELNRTIFPEMVQPQSPSLNGEQALAPDSGSMAITNLFYTTNGTSLYFERPTLIPLEVQRRATMALDISPKFLDDS